MKVGLRHLKKQVAIVDEYSHEIGETLKRLVHNDTRKRLTLRLAYLDGLANFLSELAAEIEKGGRVFVERGTDE